MPPLPKGPTRKQQKAKRARAEAKVIKAVRAVVAERDRRCRLNPGSLGFVMVGKCEGALEWCHLGRWKRYLTRGLPPEQRHCTAGSFMACAKHHHLYDSGVLRIEYGADGADGTLIVRRAA